MRFAVVMAALASALASSPSASQRPKLLARHVVSPAPLPSVAPASVKRMAVEEPEKVRDPLRAPPCRDWTASAVFESEDAERSSAVLLGAHGRRVRVGVGSDVGRLRVAGIAFNLRHVQPVVWLWDGHTICQATFEERPRASSNGAPGASVHPAPAAPSTVRVDASMVSTIMGSLPELTRGVRAVPRWADGRVQDYSLEGIVTRSLLHDLGLRNGDRVLSVNGRRVSTMQDALALYTRLMTDRDFDVALERNGARTALHLQIR